MEIVRLKCPGCGAPINEILGKYKCEYCGQEVIIESQKLGKIGNTIEQIESKTQEVSTSSSASNQLELQKLQLSHELSTLQMQLSNLRSEKRNIQLINKKTKTHYQQISQIEQEEKSIQNRMNTLQAALYPEIHSNQNHRESSINITAISNSVTTESDQKSQSIALVLAFFFGLFGAHRFYTGHIKLGILYLFTLGLVGIGWIVDIGRILFNSYKDAGGRPLKVMGPKSKKIVGGLILWGILTNIWIISDPQASPSILLVTLVMTIIIINIKFIAYWAVILVGNFSRKK